MTKDLAIKLYVEQSLLAFSDVPFSNPEIEMHVHVYVCVKSKK